MSKLFLLLYYWKSVILTKLWRQILSLVHKSGNNKFAKIGESKKMSPASGSSSTTSCALSWTQKDLEDFGITVFTHVANKFKTFFNGLNVTKMEDCFDDMISNTCSKTTGNLSPLQSDLIKGCHMYQSIQCY